MQWLALNLDVSIFTLKQIYCEFFFSFSSCRREAVAAGASGNSDCCLCRYPWIREMFILILNSRRTGISFALDVSKI